MAEGEDKAIRVLDRRMFTPEGDLRPDFEPEESPAPPPPAPARAEPKRSAPASEGAPGPAAAEPTGDFASLVGFLATNAYAALGLLANPATGSRHRDTVAARQMIDWLVMLEHKTRGNLSFEETDFLARVLYELRLAYVEVTRPPAKTP